MTEETIFSRILKGEIPCDEVYRDNQCLAFKDIEPQAPVHILIIPQKTLSSLKEADEKDQQLLGHLLLVAAKVAHQEGLEQWRTVINTGSEAGQTVFHLHLHILANKNFDERSIGNDLSHE